MNRKNIILVSVFLVSFTGLLAEILLTRIFSVTLGYHSSFFVVSLAMFGLSLGSTFLFLRPGIMSSEFEKVLYRAYLSFPLSFLPMILFVPKIGYLRLFHEGLAANPALIDYLILLALFLTCQMPFFCAGFLMSYLFIHFREESGRLYFFDLLGAASGAFLSVAVINLAGALQALIMLGVFSSVALLLVSGRRKMPVSLLVLAVFVSLAVLNPVYGIVRITEAKGKPMENIFSKWNSFSMVRVFGDENSSTQWYNNWDNPYWYNDWERNALYLGAYPPKLNMDIDADAYTPILKFDGDFKKVRFLKYDVIAFGYHLKNGSNVLVIGPGGGRDVLTALLLGSKRVVGVDINPIIVNDVMKDRFRNYSGNLYLLDNVDIVVDDARSYIRNSNDKYDVIQASLVDTWAASAAGAYSLSENNLYTVESVAEYISHLSGDGFLTISRWDGVESLRLTVLYLKAAEKLGIGGPGRHIILVRNKCVSNQLIVNQIFKKSEFTEGELEKISLLAEELGIEVLYMPGSSAENEYGQILNSRNLDAFIAENPYDLKPPTDDSPFFFNNKRMGSVPDVLSGVVRDIGIFVLYGLLIIALFLVSALLIAPLMLRWRYLMEGKREGTFLHMTYFALLGLSFMIMEVTLMQEFMLFLGHPVYATTVVISTLLLSAGSGSYVTGRFLKDRLKPRLKAVLLCIVGVIAIFNVSLYHLFNMLLGLSVSARIVVSVVLLGILGFFAGMPFPLGVRMVGLKHEGLIPFCYSLNGAFSVLGSILALILSMNVGFTNTIFIAAGLYLLAYAASSSKDF